MLRLRILGILSASVALVAGFLIALSPTSTAAPQVARAETTCHSFSQGTKSWIDWKVENISCEHAHAVGRSWGGQCGRSSSTVTPMTCTVTQHVDGHDLTFHCSNTKGPQSPANYQVRCHHETRKLSFTYFAHGF